jgi:Tfp pilus assembly protein PilE
MNSKLASVIVLSILSLIALVSIENFNLRKEIKILQEEITSLKKNLLQKQTDAVKEIRRSLPVCTKNESHSNCRPLAADETDTTIRGVRNEEAYN